MNSTLSISIAYLVGISLLLVFNEIIFRWFRIPGEYTRKFAHIASTLAVLPFPYLFPSHWYVFVLAILFFIVLNVSQYGKHLNSIHGIGRPSVGSYLLPVSIYLTFLFSGIMESKIAFILPMIILAICDPLAAIAGMSIKKHNRAIDLFGYKSKKTWAGSLVFFLSATLLSTMTLFVFVKMPFMNIVWISMLVGIAGTLAELFSWRGSDNLTIPLSVQFVLILII